MLLSNLVIFLSLLIASVRGDTSYTPDITTVTSDHVAREIRYFDDSSNVLLLRQTTLSISFDDGKSFEKVKTISEPVVYFQMDPFNRNRAFAFTLSENQYVTEDKGRNWRKFKADLHIDENSNSFPQISFNVANPDYLMISSYKCPPQEPFTFRCKQTYYYTKDGFKSVKKLPLDGAHICKFVKSTKTFKADKDETILCITNDINSFGHVVASHLYKSDNFFSDKQEITLGKQSDSGIIIDIKVEETFIIAIVNLDKFNEKSRVHLYISKDGQTFAKADLEIDVKYGVMSFLPSSASSLFFQILQYSNDKFQASKLYSSDSFGLHYTTDLEQIAGGNIQKVENIDGAWIANVGVDKSDNNDDESSGKSVLDYLVGGIFSKNIITKYSFNDGREWNLLKSTNEDCKISSGCSVHLWEYSELDGEGKFVTGPTPGILMGVGNTGSHLNKDFSKLRTFVSRDGGASWTQVLDFPTIFSFGDQGNVIVAIPFGGKGRMKPSDKVYYSLDQGKSWNNVDLKNPIYPLAVLTTIDGTSRNFLLAGATSERTEVIYTLDFTKAYDGVTCKDDAYEEYYARSIADNPPLCIYGHREKFRRRKQDQACFVNKLFEDVKVIDEPCPCIDLDFECALGFKSSPKDQHICIPDPAQLANMCKGQKELKLEDKVLIDGDKCDLGKKKLSDFIVKETIDCTKYNNDKEKPGNTHDIVVNVNEIEGELVQYAYIDESKQFGADNIVLKSSDNHVYVSNSGGVSFVRVPIPDKIVAFYTGPIPGQVILITESKLIYVSRDGGATFIKQQAPTPPHPLVPRAVAFHTSNPDKFIWFGGDCESQSDCPVTAYITDNSGSDFFKVPLKNVQTCDFVGAVFENPVEDLLFCASRDGDNKLKLVSLTAGSNEEPKVLYPHIVGYAITGNYVVVATVNQKDDKRTTLEAKVTVDGKVFADADFPHDFQLDSQQAYTILDSKTKAIFLHMTTSLEPNFEYGAILKSNSNGTSYALVLDAVNRNREGYVDYDRIDDGLEGVIISNIVANPGAKNSKKQIQTMITHNDGGEWNFLLPPAVDSKNQKYKCQGSKCHLHLHGFTERADYRDTYSSGSATGFLIGAGNVGEYLEDYDKSSTFMSKDGGVTWKEIKQGNYMWEYGDHGTILVLVSNYEETNTLLYSLDEGESWIEYKFADSKVRVLDLATVPTDTSRKFVIFAKDGDQRKTLAYSIDFTNIHPRQCQLDLDHPDKDDYEYWSPMNPSSLDVEEPKCLFGHEAKYLRRAKGHYDCFIGSAPVKDGFKVIRNCSCTRRDYECDYNYYRDTDNTCKLVKGLTPEDKKKEMCEKPGAFEYFVSTGYRKIPLTTCEGGKQFDSWNPLPCPGKQKEFNHHYGTEVTGHKLFLLLFVPLVIFLGAFWFVYDRGIRRNGGFKRLGQIRLDDDENGFDPIENNQVDVIVNRVVKGGIFAVAITVATFKTIIKIDKMIFERMTSVFLGRAPGRRNYVNVPDEFEDEEAALFGDYDDDEEELQDDTRLSEQTFRDDDIVDIEQHDQQEQVPADERLFDIESEDDLPIVTPEE
ncbi:uncharacterized protein SPAPADRAFT_138012 [Spathaspora passalidarum NRRL Y-27907]|uniref:VPS10 domain-containing protein n=1 Tax=Spathaspora passalidarum (strain NRRL Y-27907 / 11-Y1) TaxID=619300 RepID=G3ANC4_SPAPN|nr:uncharacterized protein SPAPADRAFT_138012 [Spathaspora passalidarum NRRL Y-27907]EGW32507.1 hypothetical protein SPAPADRAFT_138012 [Spathaspora passalidarum NRRL Y-27907]